MVWGQAERRGVEDLVERLRNNDPNLKSLTLLRGRRFGPEEVVRMCDALDANYVLQEFYASGHLLMPPSAKRFAETLAKNVCLRRIGLGNAELGDAGLEALAPGIAASTSLQAIDLEHKGIGREGIAAFAQALKDSPSLVEIQLNRNPIGQRGISCLANPWLGRVQVLELREVDSAEGTGTCFEDLFLHGSSLRKVDLSKNIIAGSGVDFLARGLSHAKCLEELDLTDVGFGASHSAASVAQALASLPCLQKVVCDGCKIGPLVGPTFASILHGRSTLPLELDLSNNDLKEEAIRAIAASLESMDVARSISVALGGNGLDAESVVMLASVTYAGLKGLNLFNTSSISDCMEEFCTAIAGGGLQGVTSLDIGGCRVEMEQLELLFHSLMGGAMPSLLTLVVAANPGIEHDRFEDALDALRSKRTDLEVVWSTSDPSSALQKMPRCP